VGPVAELSGRPVLVLGGGAAGLAAAVELALRQRRVLLVEQSHGLGGLAARLACKATDVCARCGVCLVDDLLGQAAGTDLIEVKLSTSLAGLEKSPGGWTARLTGPENRTGERRVSGLILAVGGRPVDPALKSQFGYRALENVISGLELEEMIRRSQALTRPSDGARPGRVAFIQCVGSRDLGLGPEAGGQPGCSRVCCGYTARLAGWIRAYQPGTRVTIFYMDLQSWGRDPEGAVRLKEGAELIRAIPGFTRPAENGALILQFKPEGVAGLEEREFDLLVLSIGLTGPDSGLLSLVPGLERNPDGSLKAGTKDRLLVCGAAGGPVGIAQAVAQGRLAALRAAAWPEGER